MTVGLEEKRGKVSSERNSHLHYKEIEQFFTCKIFVDRVQNVFKEKILSLKASN